MKSPRGRGRKPTVKPEEIHVVWLQGQGCTGCTISLTNATNPSILDVLTGFIPQMTGIRVDFHPTIMGSWGRDAISVLEDAEAGKLDPFVLVMEGALPNEETAKKTGGFWCVVGEEKGRVVTASDWVERLSKRAAAVVGVGSCACYGGIPHGIPNPTGAKGLIDFLGMYWKSTLGIPVVCIPGCPAHGDHIVETLGYAVLAVRGILELPSYKKSIIETLVATYRPGELLVDAHHRPTWCFGKTVHEACPRAGFYAAGKYSKEYGEEFCMGLLGCKGLISHCDVPTRGFVDGIGGCTSVGAPCIGCTEPEFPDKPFSPFLAKAPVSPYIAEVWKGLGGHISAGLKRFSRRKT